MEPAERIEAARAAVDATRAVPAVHDVDGGAMGTFATMGAGERVSGVRIDEHVRRVEVRVIVRYGAHLPSLAEEVCDAVTQAFEEHAATGSWTIDVRITDVVSDEPEDDGEL